MEPRKILIALSVAKQGVWEDIYRSIANRESLPNEEVEMYYKSVKSNCVTIIDPDYPQSLRNIYHPPFVLYYYGDLSFLDNIDKNLAVVGSREFSQYGRRATESLIKDICARYVIVSGMARGIDSIAHQASIDNNGKTIAVLGSGIDYCYPKSNEDLYKLIKEKHLLISEYPNYIEPKPENFPSRNRLIVALSKAVLVTEARERSGTLISVGFALEQNKDVMCVPYRIGDESACNELISTGAYLVQKGSDIIDVMEFGNAKK